MNWSLAGPTLFPYPTLFRSSFVIDGSTTAGRRDVMVTNPDGGAGTLTNGFTVPSPVTLTLAYNGRARDKVGGGDTRSGEHTSELQSRQYLVCRPLLEKKNEW